MNKRKVTIIGAGHVGSHVALSLAQGAIADEIVLIDHKEGLAEAQALDIYDGLSMAHHDVVVRDGDYCDVEDSDVVVIAIGMSRTKSQDRVDMLDDSIVMCNELLESLKPYNIPGILISITNPCDVIVDYLRKNLHLDDKRAFGTGTLLDTARLIRVISRNTGVARNSIQAFVMGEHGESSMIPYSLIHVGPKTYADYSLDDEAILKEVRFGGWKIVAGKACTEFGIGQAAACMIGCVLRDEKRILPASVNLNGAYSQKDVQIGVPCIIGANGIEKIIEVDLTKEEKEKFNHSCDVVRGNIAIATEKGKQR